MNAEDVPADGEGLLGGEESVPAVANRLLDELAARGHTVAVAESLTGGLVAGSLTAAQGASRSFRGSVTAYATDVKRDVLGVAGDLLDERGAVDPEVARRMATGVRRVMRTDWGLATTGVAGPETQDGKPVGLVYVAVAGPEGSRQGSGEGDSARAVEVQFSGSRSSVRKGAVLAVLRLLEAQLAGN